MRCSQNALEEKLLGCYSKTVLTAANSNGDSDSIACIASAISGAYNGISTIPESWIKTIENSNLLQEIAMKLMDIMSIK